jgi:hypothetical protein
MAVKDRVEPGEYDGLQQDCKHAERHERLLPGKRSHCDVFIVKQHHVPWKSRRHRDDEKGNDGENELALYATPKSTCFLKVDLG